MNGINKERIERYLSGLADDKEMADIEFLFRNGENDEYLRQLLEKDWESMEPESIPSKVNLKSLLDRLHHTIHMNEMMHRKPTPVQRFIRVYSKVAAILLLPLIITGGLVFKFFESHSDGNQDKQVTNELYAPLGSRVSFSLPDGTIGMLNSGSRLSYSLPFHNNRQIQLKGEAWFEVERDEKNPFKIEMGEAVVNVLGTKFNVSAYPEENFIEVVLQQGKIEFLDKINHQNAYLKPSERLVYQDGKVTKTIADPEKYNGWTRGKLIFRGDPMIEVARRIERWYNVEVKIADKEIEKYSYRATFEDDNLKDVFRYLSMTSPIAYKIKPREMNPNGTYKKEVITIYLKK